MRESRGCRRSAASCWTTPTNRLGKQSRISRSDRFDVLGRKSVHLERVSSSPSGIRVADSLEGMKPTEVEAAWAALAGASACLGGLILDQSGVLDDAIDEPGRTQVKAALLDARAARDALASALHREALRLESPSSTSIPTATTQACPSSASSSVMVLLARMVSPTCSRSMTVSSCRSPAD